MSLSVLFLLVPTVVVSYHERQAITISLDSAEFIPLGEEGNQVNVFSNYTVNDPSFSQPEDKFSYESICNKWNVD